MILIVPYVHDGNAWTVPENVVRATFHKFVQDGTLTSIFYDSQVNNETAFLQFMQKPDNLPVWVLVDQVPSGVAWLNALSGDHAFAHYGLFKETWGIKSVEIAAELQKYWFGMEVNGKPVIETLLGVTPGFNSKAVKFLQKIGWTVLGEIPEMFFVPHLNKKTSAVFSYRKRI